MEFKEIQDLLKLVNKTTLTEVEIEKKEFKLKIKRKPPASNVIYTTQQPAAIAATPPPVALPVETPATPTPQAPAPEPQKVEEAPADSGSGSANLTAFKSPMIGTFYRSPSPEADPFVKVGDFIQKGQVICVIEAMKLFNEIESEVEGKVVKILVENAQPVEYEQDLFLIDPAG